MDVTIRFMLRRVAHCKEGCSILSSGACNSFNSGAGVAIPDGTSGHRGWA